MKTKTSITKFSVFLLLALFIHGCSEFHDPGMDYLPVEQGPGITIAVEKVQKVMDVQDRVTEALFRNPEVLGTGTGIDESGNPAIVVYTMTKVEQRADINIENVGRGERPTALPVSVDGVPVVPRVTGMFKAYSDPTARFPRPVPIGVSTGHPDITAGTIGCRVKDSEGNVYALSNNHVYANVNEATIGDNVLQPGAYDGGVNPDDAIGTLYDYEPIDFSADNTMDAAIALVSTSTLGTATPTGDGYGTPSTNLASADIGVKVTKYGRTTGYTFGEIAEINVTVDVCYESRGPYNCVKSARFIDQFTITPGEFSAGGDSGSLIVTDDGNNNPTGLLFAGSSTHTIASPIGVVLTRFGVTIDNESGGTVNYPPVADFTYIADGLSVSFTDQSSDTDGTVESWSWDFGDGSTSTAQSPSHSYGAGGTYTVGLTVTDDDGATGSASKDITVSETGGGDGIVLTANGYKVRGVRYVDLEWSGASGSVDIYRNNEYIATSSDVTYTDNLGRVSGTFTYKVCETGATVCSNEETIVF